MKKELKITAIVLAVVLFFIAGFGLGASKGLTLKVNHNGKTSAAPVIQTAPVVTQATTAPVTVPETSAPVATTQTQETTVAQTTPSVQETQPAQAVTDSSSMSKTEIVAKANEAINALKNTQNVKATKTEKTVINITECSASALTNVLNSICQKVAGEKTSTYEFTNGQAVGVGSDGKQLNDGNPVTPSEVIPPRKANFSLTEAGVKEATAVKNGDSTTYTIKLVSETSTVESAPTVNSQTIGYLNLTSFSIPTVSITQADIDYPESVITFTTGADGKITSLKIDQPMEGTMGAKITIVSGNVVFDGGNYESWEFVY